MNRSLWKSPLDWADDEHERVLFELEARQRFPTLRRAPARRRYRTIGYDLTLSVPHFEIFRGVHIQFRGLDPRVTVDGPTSSPHRYADGSLCMWDPMGPTSGQWTWMDGLVLLIGYIMAHLFREEWWRYAGDWLGPEAEHQTEKTGNR